MLKRFTAILLCMIMTFGLCFSVMAEENGLSIPNPTDNVEPDEEEIEEEPSEDEGIAPFGLTPPSDGQSGSNIVKVYDGFVTLTDQQLAAVNAEYGDNVSKKRKAEIAAFVKQQGLGNIIETLDTENPELVSVTYENYEKGKVYGIGDEIVIKVKATDNVAVSGVRVKLSAATNGAAGGKVTIMDYEAMVYNATTDTWDYVLTFLDYMYPGEWSIDYFIIYDTSGNEKWAFVDGYNPAKWDFSVKLNYDYGTLDTEKPELVSVTYENYEKGKVYGIGDEIVIKAKATDNKAVSSVKVGLRAATNGAAGGKVTTIDYEDMVYNATTDTWDYVLKFSDYMYPGEWLIGSFTITDTSLNEKRIYAEDYYNPAKWDFSVKLNYDYGTLDTEEPELVSVTYENYEKGKVYGIGDEIVIKVKATDNVAVSGVKVKLRAATNGAAGGKVTTIDYENMVYNATTDTWDYVLKFSDNMYPGEWSIVYFAISDTSHNEKRIYDFDYNPAKWDFSVFYTNNGVLLLPTYTVKFGYYCGGPTYAYIVLKEEKVEKYSDATPPVNVPDVNGRKFIGWSGDYTNITSDRDICAKFDGEIQSPYMIWCLDGPFDFTEQQYNYIKGVWEYTGDWRSVARRHTSYELLKMCELAGIIPTAPPSQNPEISNETASDNKSGNGETSINTQTLLPTNEIVSPVTIVFPGNAGNVSPIIIDNKPLKGRVGNLNSDSILNDENAELINNEHIGQDFISDVESKNLTRDKKEDIVTEIKQAAAGSSITVDMQSATVIPKEILEEIKGKDVDVVLDMGGYSWVINGKDVSSSDLKDIDLEVTFDNDVIPSKTVQQLAGNNPVKKVSLTYNGSFGFSAKLKINLGSENAGKYGNLYYYDSDGYMRYQNAGLIRDDGSVELVFSHASEYLVVISDEDMKSIEKPGVILSDTGNNSNTKWYVMVACVLLLCIGGIIIKKKKEENDLITLNK